MTRLIATTDRHLIIDKPTGLSVHRGWDPSPDTVLSRLRSRLGTRVYAVHRLDRATSGVLVVARDSDAASELGAIFRAGEVEKEYIALCRGVIHQAGTIDYALPSHVAGTRVPARTRYSPIAVILGRYTLLRVWPETGRRHQIRRHFKHLFHPLIGDTTYGDGKENRRWRELGVHRLALHARRLSLRPLGMTALARLPDDLRRPLGALGVEVGCLEQLDEDGHWLSD